MLARIDVRASLRNVSRDLDDLARTQVPFASVLAINDVATQLSALETKSLDDVFDRPIAFTRRAFGVSKATKASMTALVYARPIQAMYLAPSEFDEVQYLGQGRRIRTPVDIRLGGTGNIPKGAIKSALARGAFIGVVRGINGLWQRMPARRGQPERLRLLIAFTRPKHIKTHLGYHERATKFVEAALPEAFSRGLARAMATRK